MTEKIKYPRTWHLPFCQNIGPDGDHTLSEEEVKKYFFDISLVMTEKLDGENTTMYRDGIHARSISSPTTEWRTFIKGMHAVIAHDIPEGWRICGENMYAKHSIYYEDLESYFYIFGIYNENNECLSWSETKNFARYLGFPTVPEIKTFYFDSNKENYEDFKKVCIEEFEKYKWRIGYESEGFVIRDDRNFSYQDFKYHVGKYVRKDHVQTDEHWTKQKIVKNKLL